MKERRCPEVIPQRYVIISLAWHYLLTVLENMCALFLQATRWGAEFTHQPKRHKSMTEGSSISAYMSISIACLDQGPDTPEILISTGQELMSDTSRT